MPHRCAPTSEGEDTLMTVDDTLATLGHLIDGRAVRNDTTFPVHDPSTGKAFADCPQATGEQLASAIDAAERAGADWVAGGLARRQRVIGEMAAALDEHIDEIVAISTLEKGSVRGSAEAYVASLFMRHTAGTDLP